MNKDITITITQNDEQIISATITQCGGAPASEYLAAIKLLTNQITGQLDANALDIDLTLDYALSDRKNITKITSGAVSVGKFGCAGCGALASVEMPDLETVGDYGFARTALSGEFAESFAKAETIGIAAFDRCKFDSVDLSNVKTLGGRAFRAGNIRKVWIPQGLEMNAAQAMDAPFIGNENENVMIYTDCPNEQTAYEKWGAFFDNVAEDNKAPVLYGETHDEYLKE